MNERGWLTSDDPAAMLDFLVYRSHPDMPWFVTPGARKLRLLAHACASVRLPHGELLAVHNRWGEQIEDNSDCVNPMTEVNGWVSRVEPRRAVTLLRDIFGNPFRPVLTPCSRSAFDRGCRCPCCWPWRQWLTWQGGTVPNLAKAIYDERAFERTPILADALEEAGCADADILEHCRGLWLHVRGCWVIDLLLGLS